jgi:hypothetical protein
MLARPFRLKLTRFYGRSKHAYSARATHVDFRLKLDSA